MIRKSSSVLCDLLSQAAILATVLDLAVDHSAGICIVEFAGAIDLCPNSFFGER